MHIFSASKPVNLILSVFLLASFAALADDSAYRSSVEKWRQDYEATLKSDGGWLTICGLFWLHEGENRLGSDPHADVVLPPGSAPLDAGKITLSAGKVTVRLIPGVEAYFAGQRVAAGAAIELVANAPDSQITLGGLTLAVHSSGDRLSIRLRDMNCRLLHEFTSLRWFPWDARYRVTARFTPYNPPKAVEAQNLAGDIVKLTSPGFVTFKLAGAEYRLEAALDDPQKPNLIFVFRDLTSRDETYAAARFLDADPPKGGAVLLDFNKAYNPPCAYNPYTTCPLPPPANRLQVRIPAGEKKYLGPH